MNNMKVYKVYLEDTVSEDCTIAYVPSFSKESAIEYVQGNGEIIAIKETNDYLISESKLFDSLRNAGYKESETLIITRALNQIGITN